MRTPLTTIYGNIQLAHRRINALASHALDEGGLSATKLREVQILLERSNVQLGRLNRLIGDLLDVSRIHAGHLAISPTRLDLAGLVREIVLEQRAICAPRLLELDLAPDLVVWVQVDAQRIAQVVVNYLSNAFRYSAPDLPVTVGLVVEGAPGPLQARVWVRDQGPGVAVEAQTRVWERFYRVGQIEHQDGSSIGLGLGLHISRTIIEQHAGQVGVESASGAGATFWFTLPAVGSDDDARPAEG